jgi:glucosyl-3-phosphoglycerate phosphatase
MTRIVLVRHGESLWNAQRRLQGHEGVGLSPRGHEQARRTASWVGDRYPRALVVSSDLERAVETAGAIGARIGAGVQVVPELRDRHLGSWSGRVVPELEREEPERVARWRSGHDVFPEVGGESNDDMVLRIRRGLSVVLECIADRGAVVVVTHGGPIFWAVPALCGIPQGALGGPANCGVTVIETRDRVEWRLLAYNQTTHLSFMDGRTA